MNWIALTESQVLADFPTDLQPLYDQWIVDYPAKAGRLAEIVARVVSEFRDSIASNPVNVFDEDETKIPESCLRHAETMIFYGLMMEMGLSIQEEAQESMTRADIFLRQIGYGNFTTRGEDAAAPSPHYNPEPERPVRLLPVLAMLVAVLFGPNPACAAWVDTGGGRPIYSLSELDPVWATGKTAYLKTDLFMSMGILTNEGKVWHLPPATPTTDNVYTPQLQFHAFPQPQTNYPAGYYTSRDGSYVWPDPCLQVSIRQWTNDAAVAYGLDFHGSQIRNAVFMGDGSGLTNITASAIQTGAVYASQLFLYGKGSYHEFLYDQDQLFFDSHILPSLETVQSTFANLAGATFTGPVTNQVGSYAPFFWMWDGELKYERILDIDSAGENWLHLGPDSVGRDFLVGGIPVMSSGGNIYPERLTNAIARAIGISSPYVVPYAQNIVLSPTNGIEQSLYLPGPVTNLAVEAASTNDARRLMLHLWSGTNAVALATNNISGAITLSATNVNTLLFLSPPFTEVWRVRQ